MVQFRKSKKVGPFRFTLTQRGLSTSAGVGPLRVSRGADSKVRRTVRMPGLGLYDTKVVGGSRQKAPQRSAPPPVSATVRRGDTHPLDDEDWPPWALWSVALFALVVVVFNAVLVALALGVIG